MHKIVSLASLLLSVTCIAMDPPNPERDTAENKYQRIADKMLSTSYLQNHQDLPTIKGPGGKGLNLLCPHFIAKSFTNDGNDMEQNRSKVIHTFGTTISVGFVVEKNTLGLTGIFASGAKYGLLRLSLAEPTKHGNFKPGFAIAFFRTNQPSANIFAMPSLDGINDPNLFSQDFVTALPAPTPTPKMLFLENRFKAATESIGLRNANIRALTLSSVASHDEEGAESRFIEPYALVFVPTDDAKNLFDDNDSDFRSVLQGKGDGLILFEVFALMSQDPVKQRIGFIKATSSFNASSYGDKELFFKHPLPHFMNSNDR